MRADVQATRDRGFKDHRSYVAGERLHPGTEHPCQYFFGADVGPFREAIYRRDEGKCQLRLKCSGEAVLPLEGSIYERWHLEHEQGGLGMSRCWCPENVRGSCYACHIAKEDWQPRWTKQRRVETGAKQ